MSAWDTLTGLFGRRSVKLSSSEGWNLNLGSNAGKLVTADTTLQLATAWRCIKLKSRVVGAIPMALYERLADGGRRALKDHWLYELVHNSPNADQSPAEFWSGMVASIDLAGNAYARIERSGPRITALTPLKPDRMRVDRDPAGARRYRYSGPRGEETYGDSGILHLRGFTLGGDVGLSAVSYGRHTLGLALAADETASKMFANGLQLAGFIETAGGTKLTPEQRKDLVDLFAKFAGSSQAGKIMPLDPGMKFTALSMNPEDAQLLESRRFNVEEICRWFDVPPVLVGHAGEGQTMWGSGVEQIMLGWLTLDLDPLLTGIEQAICKQLLSPVERRTVYAEYNRESLLQADSAAKAAFLSTMAQNGFVSRNEGRAKLNLPKVEGGDALTVQANLMRLEDLGKVPPKATAPAPGEPV